MYFNNYFHQTAQGRTSDADFSTHASLHPLPTGSVFIRYADHKFDTLPSILKDTGYSPNAFHVYDSSFWNRYTMYKAMNYDKFYSKKILKLMSHWAGPWETNPFSVKRSMISLPKLSSRSTPIWSVSRAIIRTTCHLTR